MLGILCSIFKLTSLEQCAVQDCRGKTGPQWFWHFGCMSQLERRERDVRLEGRCERCPSPGKEIPNWGISPGSPSRPSPRIQAWPGVYPSPAAQLQREQDLALSWQPTPLEPPTAHRSSKSLRFLSMRLSPILSQQSPLEAGGCSILRRALTGT